MTTALFCILLSPCMSTAQVAGLNTLSMLQMPSSARTAALGMDYLPLFDPCDLHLGLDNPSLVNPDYNRRLAINYIGMFSGANSGTVAYGHHSKRLGTFLYGLQFNSYGRFERYDENDNPQGEFYAADYALLVGWGLQIDSSFSIGASFRPLLSQYESYTAFAFSIDLAGSYVSDDKRFAATLAASGIGAQLVTFDHTAESLPFNLSAALSYKVSNAPFRLFFELSELTRWNLSYSDDLTVGQTVDPYTGEPIAQPWYSGISNVLDGLARHMALGVEVDFSHAFFFRVGYRYRQMVEMGANDRTSVNLSGFSYGFGLRTKKFEFSFARRNYHLGQAPNYLALAFKL